MNGYNKNAALRADCYKKIVPTFVLYKLVQNTLKYIPERILKIMYKKINEQEPIQVILKVRNYHRTERDVIAEVDTFDEAFDAMNEWIEKYSRVKSHYKRFHNYEDTLVCDYGAHNANFTFTNVNMGE
jgi:hypothetical protein